MAVAAADINGDGKSDLIVNSATDAVVSVLLNTTAAGATTPTFAARQTFPSGGPGINDTAGDSGLFEEMAAADVNGDGKPDVLTLNPVNSTVSVLLNTTPAGAATASFAAQRAFATGLYPSALAVGDFNGDGKPDLAVANAQSFDFTVSVLLNTTATGSTLPAFAPQQKFPTGSTRSVAVGDLNGDGKLDLALAVGSALNPNSNPTVLLNKTA